MNKSFLTFLVRLEMPNSVVDTNNNNNDNDGGESRDLRRDGQSIRTTTTTTTTSEGGSFPLSLPSFLSQDERLNPWGVVVVVVAMPASSTIPSSRTAAVRDASRETAEDAAAAGSGTCTGPSSRASSSGLPDSVAAVGTRSRGPRWSQSGPASTCWPPCGIVLLLLLKTTTTTAAATTPSRAP
jgi:hypothetical protein